MIHDAKHRVVDAYDEGRSARCSRAPLSSNPYDEVSQLEEHATWVDGWTEADDDIRRLARKKKYEAPRK